MLGADSERSLLTRLGLDYTVLDSGCCGMAGVFGFDENKYEVSVKIGERVFLLGARGERRYFDYFEMGIAVEQIAQTTGWRALHSAEV